jgi:hypothetical protein
MNAMTSPKLASIAGLQKADGVQGLQAWRWWGSTRNFQNYHRVRQQGFEFRKDWGYFVRDQTYGFDALPVVNQGTAKGRFFEIKCYAEVRHDRIEIPWNTLGMVYGEDNQRQTWTLNYKDMAGLQASPMKVVPESITTDGQEVTTLLVQKALPFYQRFGDLSEVEEWVNKNPLADTNRLLEGR